MDYHDFVRPKYVELMQALGLECQFHRASGSELFYRDPQGAEVAVTDFLGGYGAALFGHNDPQLVEQLCGLLRGGVPFNAQMSVRGAAGELGRALSEAFNRELNNSERFISTFSNSGAEAVEIAVKHAEYRRQKALTTAFDALDFELSQLSASDKAYVELDVDDLDLPAGLLPAHLRYVTLRQVVEAARQHNLAQLHVEPVFVAMRGSFHGKLVNTVQLTYGKQYRQPFSRFGLKVEFLDPQQPEQLQDLHSRHSADWLGLAWQGERLQVRRQPVSAITAVLLEPIQGEGGIREFPQAFYLAVRRFCNEQQCPLIVDEVQSGFGRTGHLLASSHFKLQGDYYCLSKALGGGLTKIAATLIRDSHYDPEFSYIHSSTFAEDDVSCRIALSALERLYANDGEMLKDIQNKGLYLKTSLLELQSAYPDVIAEVRGRGLLLGIELHDLTGSSSLVQASAQYNDALGYIIAGYLLQHQALRVAPSGS
ncbi:MAG: aminotransferase class III-fold pyridoxal phosphate-dependent enzyme, partial [Pseudomonadota bacterium]